MAEDFKHIRQLPCTPAGIVGFLHACDVHVEGRHAVNISRGLTIGRPLAAYG